MDILWVIWSNEHDAWWAKDGNGYVKDAALAGLYETAAAFEICKNANRFLAEDSMPNEVCIPATAVRDAINDAQKAGEVLATLRWAHWKDGVQYVGSCGTTLVKALADIK